MGAGHNVASDAYIMYMASPGRKFVGAETSMTGLQSAYREIVAAYRLQVPFRPLKPDPTKSLNNKAEFA